MQFVSPSVLSQRKTQPRRLVEPGERLLEANGTAHVESDRRIVYQTGKQYAVQPGWGKVAVARLLLTGLRREQIEAISEADARAVGFASHAAFLDTWRAIHGAKLDPRH